MTIDSVNSEKLVTRLTFEQGRFTLLNPPPEKLEKIRRDPYWKYKDAVTYETLELRAAVAFKSSADSKTQRIFQRTFQAHYSLPELPPLPELDPHQQAGLRWVLARKRSYLAHAPGAGKTAQAILLACLSPGTGPALFIIPPSLVPNWEREIWKVTEWIGRFPTIGIIGRSDDQDRVAWRADFILCPDSMLTKMWAYLQLKELKPKVIGVDEASRFKEFASERSTAFYGGRGQNLKGEPFSYPGLFRDAKHVVFLDGSPMPNGRPIELWAPLYALHPEAIDCMNRDDFGYHYCGARPNERGQWEYLYSSHEHEFRERLTADFMHIVTEEQLTHPERKRSLLFMGEDVRSAEHKTWDRKHLKGLKLDELDEESSQGEMARFRRELGVRKTPWAAAYVKSRLSEKNESILVFAWHREVIEELAIRLADYKPGIIMGGVSAQRREADIARFQAGKCRLMILNIAAGGRGHNLQKADRAIFVEPSWSDEANKQCEKRGSRRGSMVEIFRSEYIVCPGSMDEPVLQSLFSKERRTRRIIG